MPIKTKDISCFTSQNVTVHLLVYVAPEQIFSFVLNPLLNLLPKRVRDVLVIAYVPVISDAVVTKLSILVGAWLHGKT